MPWPNIAAGISNSAISTLRARRAELAGEYQKLMPQFTPDYPAAKALQAQIAQEPLHWPFTVLSRWGNHGTVAMGVAKSLVGPVLG